MLRRLLCLVGCCVVVVLCAAPAGAWEAYGMDRTSTLYRFDPATGVATAIGPLGIGPVTGSAIDPATGILYTGLGGQGTSVQTNSGCLYTVSTTTGAAALVGCDLNQKGVAPIPGLSFGSDGFLYGLRLDYILSTGHMHLCRINTATGALTDISASGTAWCIGHGIAFGGGGELYSHDYCVGLSTLSLTDGSQTVIGDSFVGFPGTPYRPRVPDMALDPSGVMWAIVVSGQPPTAWYTGTVNLTTGDVTYVATLPTSIQTIAFAPTSPPVPLVGEWGLILLIISVGLTAAYLLATRRARTA